MIRQIIARLKADGINHNKQSKTRIYTFYRICYKRKIPAFIYIHDRLCQPQINEERCQAFRHLWNEYLYIDLDVDINYNIYF